jgi:hypothetical protein
MAYIVRRRKRIRQDKKADLIDTQLVRLMAKCEEIFGPPHMRRGYTTMQMTEAAAALRAEHKTDFDFCRMRHRLVADPDLSPLLKA